MRPSVLQPPRTCGFPQSAVESSQCRIVTHSRVFMKCISSIQRAWRNFSASCSVTRSNSTLSVPTPVRIHSPACVTLQQGAAVVAAPATFERLRAVARDLRAGLARVTLRPFAPPVFQPASSLLRTLLTSRSLAWSKSPRVRTWTIDPCRRALPQGSFGDGWISRSLAACRT